MIVLKSRGRFQNRVIVLIFIRNGCKQVVLCNLTQGGFEEKRNWNSHFFDFGEFFIATLISIVKEFFQFQVDVY